MQRRLPYNCISKRQGKRPAFLWERPRLREAKVYLDLIAVLKLSYHQLLYGTRSRLRMSASHVVNLISSCSAVPDDAFKHVLV